MLKFGTNNGEKKFILMYKDGFTKPIFDTMKAFVDFDHPLEKRLYWGQFTSGCYILSTFDKTAWDVDTLQAAIVEFFKSKHIKHPLFLIFEVSDSPMEGRVDDFWRKFILESVDLTSYVKLLKRKNKIEAIKKRIEEKNKPTEPVKIEEVKEIKKGFFSRMFNKKQK